MKKKFAIIILLFVALLAAAQENISGDDAAVEPELTESAPLEDTVAVTAEDTAIKDTPAVYAEDAAADTHEMHFAARFGIALGIVAGQVLLSWLIWLLFKFLSQKVINSGGDKIKPLIIRKFKLLSAKQIVNAIVFGLKIFRYMVICFQLFLTVPIVFSLFPPTRHLAMTIFGYILNPVKDIGIGFIKYIPNLFTIIVIVVVTRYVIKALKYLSVQITKGKLVIPGFYADWAEPTYRILQVLLWAFTVAIVYPYLPGSESRIFQGVSVFVGIIFTLGSSTAIGNLVAGLVITYMRPFKIGDRVQIKDSTGFVVEKTMMVVRLKTHKNEYVTFPNLIILNSAIINYNTSSDEDAEGLILNTEVTFGYATPWQTVHEILINAALATGHVLKSPKPFVLQTNLDDFYAHYQINCYTKDVDIIPKIYAQLYENIQNGFREAGIDMTAPHYEVFCDQKNKKR
ncbi:MAG: mechanosensitive ion channel [Treponema sp.]|jgi:small-conductance mechanosensitive channel|nr:mechanosensitive ion channel [Treponema sp.]